MDPKTGYFEMWAMFRAGLYEEALEHALDNVKWVDNGGFVPKGIPHYYNESQFVATQSEQALSQLKESECNGSR